MSDWRDWQQPQPSSGAATAALVLGICGLTVCPLVCSILALVLGYQARAEIDESGGRIGGRSSAVAGIVLGWVGIGLCAVFIGFFALVIGIGSNLTVESGALIR